jgi:hypothetical protein
LSGLFSSLINEDFQQIRAGINEALGKAQDEQAAKDQKEQAKWQAGKISDEQWLAYIRSRISDSTDPQERSQWQQILLQNQDAISDAQWETKFQQNKITVGQLLAHYKERMGRVRANSPAYRELASRRVELLQFQRSGGVHYSDQFGGRGSGGGSGGGSRSGGSGGGSGSGGAAGSLQRIINKGLRGGDIDAGYMGGEVYNTRGPNLVGVQFGRPATSSRASLFVAVADGLLGSQKMLEGFFNFIALNPKATAYTIPGTGQIIPITPRTLRAADDQYLRVTTTLVNVYHKKGDISEANYQETKIGQHVTVTMRDHNAIMNQSNEDNLGMWVKRQFARMNAASTPDERIRIAKESSTMLDKYMQRHYPVSKEITTARTRGEIVSAEGERQQTYDKPTTLEDQLPPEVYRSHASLGLLFDMAANPDKYTDEDIDMAFDDAQTVLDIGEGAGRIHLADLFGNGGETSTIGANALGVGDFRNQFLGLRAADLISRGLATPDDVPEGMDLYAYTWNSAAHKMEPAIAVATPQPDGTYDVVPGSVDANGNVSAAPNAIKYMSNINGKQVPVFTPLITAPPASGYIYRFAEKMTVNAGGKQVTFNQGDLVPSSVLEGLGSFNVNAYATAGRFVKDAPPGIAQADVAGKTWYFDLRTNTWSPTNPWQIEPDKTDPNAVFVLDPPYVVNSAGGYGVDTAKAQGPSAYIAADLAPGTEGFVMPFDTSMTPKEMQDWIDGEIAAGRIIPNEYRYVDADGNVVEMTQDQLMVSYFDPVVEARKESLRKTRLSVSGNLAMYGTVDAPVPEPTDADLILEAKRRMSIEAGERARAEANAAADPNFDARMFNQASHLQRLEEQAASLGIRTGATVRPQPPEPKRSLDDNMLRTAALQAAQNREKIARQPRLEPLPADPKPPVVKPVIKPVRRDPLSGSKVGKPPPINVLTGVERSTDNTLTQAERAARTKRLKDLSLY